MTSFLYFFVLFCLLFFMPEKALFIPEISVKMAEKALIFYGFLV